MASLTSFAIPFTEATAKRSSSSSGSGARSGRVIRRGPCALPRRATAVLTTRAAAPILDPVTSVAAAASSRRAMVLGSLGSLALTAVSVVGAKPAWASEDDASVAPASNVSAEEASLAPSSDVPAGEGDVAPSTPQQRERCGVKNVIITGSNSGIGFDAASKLAAQGYCVTLACRTQEKAADAKLRIEDAARVAGTELEGNIIAAECDLADLSSVRRFAASWHSSGQPLDALVLNAGVQYSGENDPRRTVDGFEITVGTNHLGHFLLTNLLLPDLEATGAAGTADGAPRIVVTASEVHDPASAGGAVGLGATLGNLSGLDAAGAGFSMLDGSEYNADKAYKDSKLCNVLFARELERRLQATGSPVQVNAFGPGLITRTGFFRYQNPLFVKLFDFATNEIFHVAETVSGGGDCLVYMVTAPDLEGRGGLYYNNGIAAGEPTGHKFEAAEVSSEARDDAEAAKLWRYSEKLVGLSTA